MRLLHPICISTPKEKRLKLKGKKIRVLVVDDHDMVRSGLIALLDHDDEITVVGEASNGLEAISKVAVLFPDVVLMDIKMQVIDGVEATTTITRDHPGARVLIVTHLEHEAYIKRMMKLGASGYIVKSRAIEDLKRGIRMVHDGGRFISAPYADLLVGPVGDEGPCPEGNNEVSLTPREHQVLQLLVSGCSILEIVAELQIDERTVEFYEANLFEKLGVDDRCGLVQFAQKQNLMDTES